MTEKGNSMIIIMFPTEYNRKAAELMAENDEKIMAYPHLDYQDIKDERLIIINLTARLRKQQLLDNGLLIKMLEEKAPLPASIKLIDLVYSDVDKKTGLAKQTDDISYYFRRKDYSNREVSVRHVHDNNRFYFTIIVPPTFTDTQEWCLYGLSKDQVAAYEANMKLKDENSDDNDDDEKPLTDYLEFIKDQKIEPFWKGKDMREYMSKSALVALATPVAEKEDGSPLPEPTLFKPLFKPAETSKRSARIEIKGDDTEQPQKQARIDIDESKQTIAFVLPFSPETQKFMEHVQEEYKNKFQSSSQIKAPS
jgi:hypothetical protein